MCIRENALSTFLHIDRYKIEDLNLFACAIREVRNILFLWCMRHTSSNEGKVLSKSTFIRMSCKAIISPRKNELYMFLIKCKKKIPFHSHRFSLFNHFDKKGFILITFLMLQTKIYLLVLDHPHSVLLGRVCHSTLNRRIVAPK